ncbi:MAG: hypothetical protein IPI67_38945 [Myxococcales bacterium]|nr:hypothetical protein [Myxococcales bacterium]
MLDWYRRYRKWAHEEWDQRASVAMAACAGAAGAGLLSLWHIMGWSWRPLLGWVCLIGGPIAAFDAWGAAMYRGRAGEAWARSALIVVISLGAAWVGFGTE